MIMADKDKKAFERFCVNYLVENTNCVWEVELEQEHIDFQIKCKYDDNVVSTRSFDFTEIKTDSDIKLLLNGVIAYWMRFNE